MVVEHRSRSCGDTVGSWVEMNIRVPLWRCIRTDVRSVLVRVVASVVEFIYYPAHVSEDYLHV